MKTQNNYWNKVREELRSSLSSVASKARKQKTGYFHFVEVPKDLGDSAKVKNSLKEARRVFMNHVANTKDADKVRNYMTKVWKNLGYGEVPDEWLTPKELAERKAVAKRKVSKGGDDRQMAVARLGKALKGTGDAVRAYTDLARLVGVEDAYKSYLNLTK